MTHEYLILTGGVVYGARGPATALGWAADRILAVGGDDEVRAISRGDSTFLDLEGRAVTPAPVDERLVEVVLREAVAQGRGQDPVALLLPFLASPEALPLEPGSAADVAIWSRDPGTLRVDDAERLVIVTVVRGGHFTTGDPHQGPLHRAAPAPTEGHAAPSAPTARGQG